MRNGSITWEWPTRLRKKCLRYVITDITDHCSRNALVWEDNMSTEGEENEGFWQSSTAEIATVNAHWKEHFSRNKAGDIFNDNIPARYSLQLPDICWIIMVFTFIRVLALLWILPKCNTGNYSTATKSLALRAGEYTLISHQIPLICSKPSVS